MTLLGRYSLSALVHFGNQNKIKQTFNFYFAEISGRLSTMYRVYTSQMFVDDAHDPLGNACLLNRIEETLHLLICTKMKNVAFLKNPVTI